MAKAPVSRRARASSAPPSAAPPSAAPPRHELVQLEAYLISERRGFTPGNELDDWLQAEQLVDDRAAQLPVR